MLMYIVAKLEAKGVYNLDTRAYTITGIAKGP